MAKYYQGKYRPKNTAKYRGDPTNVVYRSWWERCVFRYLDMNPSVKSWSSEETIVPYRCATDKRMHRYFVDIKFTTIEGETFLIEIKPKKETIEPKRPARKSKRYLTEVLTYVKNCSKWKAAEQYAADRGWTFDVWHEEKLEQLGIKLLKPMKKANRKRAKKKASRP